MAVWKYEGISCYVSKKNIAGHLPLYRAWNGKDHFYTINKNEYDRLPSSYSKEGIACYVEQPPQLTTDHKPFYRFYHSRRDDHIYTSNENERRNLDNDNAWINEGVCGSVLTSLKSEHVPLYRAYNNNIVDHFYSTNWNEIQRATGWQYEGIACYVAKTQLPGHVPLYRAWNGKDHFYTINKVEYDGLPSSYTKEGIACYIERPPEFEGSHKPFYRFYNSSKDDHIYTVSDTEKGNLERDNAWISEGIACAVSKNSITNHVPLYRAYNSEIVDHFYTTSWKEIEQAMDPVIEKNTLFDPVKHGFKFPNQFTVSPSIFGLDLGSWNMGFCGGMCAAALNRFNNNISIPTTTQTPHEGTELYDELLNRQIRSIPPNVIAKIYDWQSASDVGHWWRSQHSVGYRTRKEWPTLQKELDSNKPTNLILIRVEGFTANISENHQVLAIGYRYNTETKDLTIKIYDPNHKNQINELSMNIKSTNIHAKDSSNERLRGFFVNPAGESASS